MNVELIDLEKKSRSSLREIIYDRIKQMIVTCSLAPGQVVNEGELAGALKVSKTPVREALTQLQQDNLVELLPRRGYLITHLTLKDIRDIFEVRLILERSATSLATEHATDDEIKSISRFLEMKFDPGDITNLYNSIKFNIEFHMEIAHASRNERLIWHLGRVYVDAQRLQYMDLQRGGGFKAWDRDHERIVDALQKRDKEAAESAIESSLTEALNRLLRL